ncbi:MAG: UDP-N-acetyl glucosamine 2-epimerase [Planctomycetota bacterium]|nr:MAG: UDP-N-acetyl glucosamine 2-epimerase [Planctomycetota bacterium]
MKAAPLLRALEAAGHRTLLLHTGQHRDPALSGELFAQLGLRSPDLVLCPGPERPSFEAMLAATARWCREVRPRALVVFGDVDSTAAAALGAHRAETPVVHAEAGLRSFDRSMPEEVNRILADAVSSLLLASEPAGLRNLEREGRRPDEMVLVGNLMIDTLEAFREDASRAPLPEVLRPLLAAPFGLLTLHRPANVDTAAALRAWRELLAPVAARIPLVFPVHPRTARSLDLHRERAAWERIPGLTLLPPLGYLQCLRLQSQARLVLTDSGGVSEEASVLDTPCLVLREHTERPITVERGTALLVGRDRAALERGVELALAGRFPRRGGIELWDGRAAPRAVRAVEGFLARLSS